VRRGAQIAALLETWAAMDLFGRNRKEGDPASGSLTGSLFSQGFLSYVFAALCFPDPSPARYAAATMAFTGGLGLLGLAGDLQDICSHPADRDLVAACPISASTLRAAKALRLVLLLIPWHLGLALPPALLGIWIGGPAFPLPYLGLSLLHALGLIACFHLPILAAGRCFGSEARTNMAVTLRALALAGFFLGSLLALRAAYQGPSALPGGSPLLAWLPPAWFALALTAPSPTTLLPALAFAPAAGLLLLAVSRLPVRRRKPRRRGSRFLRATTAWMRTSPLDLGLTEGLGALLARDRSFRLRALPLLGIPAAVVVLALRSGVEDRDFPLFLALVHGLPLIWLPFLLHFLPYCEDHEASWILESAPLDPIRAGRRGLVLCGAAWMLALQAALFAMDALFRGPLAALPTTLAALGLTWWMLPLLARSLRRPVFSLPAADLAPPELPGLLLGFGVAVPIVQMICERLPLPLHLGLGLLAAATGLLRVRRAFALPAAGGGAPR